MSALDSREPAQARPEGLARTIQAAELFLRVEQRDGETLLALHGELDLTSAPALDRELGRAISDAQTIVVDLSALQFIDSTGLQSVVLAARQAREAERMLLFFRPSPKITRLLRLTGVEEILWYFD
jgi:anti-anti-sigma factor